MAYCGNCGTEVADGMKFCSNCGAEMEQQDSDMTGESDKGKKGVNKWLWVGIGIAALAASIFGILNHSTWVSVLASIAGLTVGIVCLVKSKKLRGFAIAAIVIAVLNFVTYAYGYESEVKDRKEVEAERDRLEIELQDARSNKSVSTGNRPEYRVVPKGSSGSSSDNGDDSSKSTAEDDKENSAGLTTGGVDSDLKAFLDSYEAFMDDYIDFMQKYMANPTDLSLLAGYADIMTKYADFADKIDKYDSDDMSTADAAYYLEVTTRVTQKMLKVLGTTSM